MYYAYQYILANEGLDTSNGYPYRGRVSEEHTCVVAPKALPSSSNLLATTIQSTRVLKYLAAFRLRVEMNTV